jgi:hypothetical protein
MMPLLTPQHPAPWHRRALPFGKLLRFRRPVRVRIPLVLFELASRLIAFHLRDVASGARRKPAELLKRH